MTITLTTENWQQHANCADVPPELMQPEIATAEDIDVAKATCGKGTAFECPVLAQCRELAESQTSRGEGTSAYGVHASKWYGHQPAPVLFCRWCSSPLAAMRSRRAYCNDTCRKRASRAREAASAA